jgi:hypothetical protein
MVVMVVKLKIPTVFAGMELGHQFHWKVKTRLKTDYEVEFYTYFGQLV